MLRTLRTLRVHFRFVLDYVKANFLIALEYRASFFGQVISMMLNDAMWVGFWWIYFTRFQVLQGGWRIEDVLALWAVTAVAFAFSVGFFGNSLRIAEIVSQGGLDYYLVLPKNVLLHVLVSRMDISAWGDLLFGTGVFVVFLQPTPDRILLFLAMSVCGAAVFLAFNIFWQSLAFWLGNAEGLASQLFGALITFSTYPPTLFRGFVKGLLFTAIPATFLSHVPVQLLRQLDPAWLIAEIAFAAGALTFSVAFFYRGLRRYESGNLMTVRT
jgi:viologen exporter family transport system permease protein